MDANESRRRGSKEAAEWWVILQEESTRSDRERFVDWLRESPIHVTELLRVAQVHGALDTFERWTQITIEDADERKNVVPIVSEAVRKSPQSSDPAPGILQARWKRWIVAASICVIAAVSWLVLGFRGQVIQTERGERREVTLADGSLLKIDPQTRLVIKFEDESRRVILERGRALFHVAKNANRPFLVYADDSVVRAVGTAFGVEQHTQGIVVTVAEGEIALYPKGDGQNTGSVPNAIKQTRRMNQRTGPSSAEVFLVANEQVTLASSGVLSQVRKVDSDRELAWADGRLIFDNDPVSAVVEVFNRYNRIQLQVTDASLAKRPVSGVFSASDPESFVAFIGAVEPGRIAVRREGQYISIAGRD